MYFRFLVQVNEPASFLTYNQFFYKSNTTGVTSGAGTFLAILLSVLRFSDYPFDIF
jgi:hypothetical protein